MKGNLKQTKQSTLKNRDGEKGAALVIVLMIASIMLVASVGVLLQASLNSANVSDVNAEQQAYNAAESGVQTALNILRGNTTPNPLIDDTKPANHSSNRISFSKAVRLSTSNETTDTSTIPRLSRWMNYDYTPGGAIKPERVTLGSTTYTPLMGNAFDVEIIDPDNPQKIVSIELNGDIDGGGNSKTFGSFWSSATITYNSSTHTNVDVSIREANIDLGNFTLTTTGFGAFIPNDIRFEIAVRMTAPFKATKIIRGSIKAGYISPNSTNIKIDFDSPAHIIMGSVILLPDPLALNAPNTNSGRTDINITITLSEPIRLIIRSTGYGPRGAKKVLEAMVQKDLFNGGLIPATLAMVGSSSSFLLKPGTNNLMLSGDDSTSNINIPPIATTSSNNLTNILSSIICSGGCNPNLIGNPANISQEIPDWLSSTAKLDATVKRLKTHAIAAGGYYAKGEPPANFGNNAEGTGLTFIDDDATLSGAGGGILVVTGKLILKDHFDFNGIILVTGKQGIEKNGNGNGSINGNVVVAPYDQSDLTTGFLSPKFDVSGGGVSNIMLTADVTLYNLTAGYITVLGIAEK